MTNYYLFSLHRLRSWPSTTTTRAASTPLHPIPPSPPLPPPVLPPPRLVSRTLFLSLPQDTKCSFTSPIKFKTILSSSQLISSFLLLLIIIIIAIIILLHCYYYFYHYHYHWETPGCRFENVEMKDSVTSILDTFTLKDYKGTSKKWLLRYRKCSEIRKSYLDGD